MLKRVRIQGGRCFETTSRGDTVADDDSLPTPAEAPLPADPAPSDAVPPADAFDAVPAPPQADGSDAAASAAEPAPPPADIPLDPALRGKPHPASFPEERLADDVKVSRTRRGGPGGQHRNKVETAVVLKHLPSGATAEANERRSAGDNRTVAFFRLRVNLAIEVRREPNPDQTVCEAWTERVHGGKIGINPAHRDFPTLLAEALDRLAVAGWEFAPAAEALRVTPSQLMKFLRLEPRAWQLVNRRREERGLHRLQ